MRHALSVALFLAVLGAAAPAARAEWLVLVGGKRIETEGPWTLKGDLLTVHETSGRILSVGTSTVDTAACLKANGGSLRIEAVSVPPPPGAPVVKPEVISPSARPTHRTSRQPPARTGSAGSTAGPAGTADTAAAKAPAAAGAAGAATDPAVSATAAGKPPRDDRLTAAKLARQARLERELRYQQIVDGCARMFIVDRAGFRRCVDAQTKAPPAPQPPQPPPPPVRP
jgi:hypothetical protein